MSAHANKTGVARYGELWNTGHLSIVDELLTEDFVLWNSDGTATSGHAAFKAGVAHHHDTLTGFRVVIDDLVAEEELVALRFTARAVHTGPLLGSVPSNKPLAWTGMQLLRFRAGRIAGIWHHPDDLNLLRQLGRVQETVSTGG